MPLNYIRATLVAFFRRHGIVLPGWSIILPLLGVVTSETLLFFGFVRATSVGYVLTLLICVLGPLSLDGDVAVFQAFALIPVFRLVNLGMPVFVERTIYWFPLIYGALIPATYVIGQTNESVSLEPGWKPAVVALPLAVPVTALLGIIEYRILRPEALIPEWNVVQLVVLTVIMVGFVGLVEELIFRGVLQRTLTARLGTWPGIFLTSAIFGLMHAGYRLPEELLFATCIGLLFGFIYNKTDSIALITVMHGLLNVFLFAIIPLQGTLRELFPT